MNLLLKSIYNELNITEDILANYKLPFCEEASLKNLEVVDIDHEGRPFILTKEAGVAWKKMCEAAKSDGVILRPYSGFRSYVYQKNLLERKLNSGRELQEILLENAIPGFSEHHTGRAVDVIDDEPHLEIQFEKTAAFTWLTKNAHRFQFSMTYPRENTTGITYEPWHWCYNP